MRNADAFHRDAFRAAQRRLAATVAVITSGQGVGAVGMTATAVTSVSMDPPTLLVCVNRSATLNAVLAGEGRFRVAWLADHQEDVARAFGDGRPQPERFAAAGDFQPLADCRCRLVQAIEAGSHSIFVGEVEAASVGEGAPLLYCDGGYRRVA